MTTDTPTPESDESRGKGDKITAYFITSSALLEMIESSTEAQEVRTMLLDSLHANQITLVEFFYDVITGHCLHLLPAAAVDHGAHAKLLKTLHERVGDKHPQFTSAILHYTTDAYPFELSLSDRLANQLLDLVFGLVEIKEDRALECLEPLFDLVAWVVTRLHSDVIRLIGKVEGSLLVLQNGKCLWVMSPPQTKQAP